MPPRTLDTQPLDLGVLEQAATWLMRLGSTDANEDDRHAWQRWHSANPEHARAWARAERLQGLIAAVPPSMARPVLDRPTHPARRLALKQLGALALLGPVGWLAWRLWEHARWDQTLQSSTGQRAQLRLPDQGVVELDTQTAIDIAYSRDQRLVRLRAGQIHIQTAADRERPSRPFRVATEHGRMEALGTRFNVRVHQDRTVVTVLEGAVQLEPAGQTSLGCRVDAGQSAWFNTRECSPVASASPGATTWRHGMLAADALPLSALLQELGRYRQGVLRCDPAVAELLVSGAFPLDDSDRTLQMLARTYPVRIQRRASGWWTTVEPSESRPAH